MKGRTFVMSKRQVRGSRGGPSQEQPELVNPLLTLEVLALLLILGFLVRVASVPLGGGHQITDRDVGEETARAEPVGRGCIRGQTLGQGVVVVEVLHRSSTDGVRVGGVEILPLLPDPVHVLKNTDLNRGSGQRSKEETVKKETHSVMHEEDRIYGRQPAVSTHRSKDNGG